MTTFCLYRPSGHVQSFIELPEGEPGVPDGLLAAPVQGGAKELAQLNLYYDEAAGQLDYREYEPISAAKTSVLVGETLTITTPAGAWVAVNNQAFEADGQYNVVSDFPVELIITLDGKYYSNNLIINVVPLEVLKAERLTELADVYAQKNSVYQTPYGPLQIADHDRINLVGAVSLAMVSMSAGVPFQMQWIMDDNTVADFNGKPQEFIQFAASIGIYYSQIVHYNAQLKEQIRGAQDQQALYAIDINGGWPS